MSDHQDNQADPINALYYEPYKAHAYEEEYTDRSLLMRKASTRPIFEQRRSGWARFPMVITATRPVPVLCFTKVGWDAEARFGLPTSDSHELNGISNMEVAVMLGAIGAVP